MKTIVDNLGIPVEFSHSDEFLEPYHVENFHFPAAFLRKEPIAPFIDHTEISACETLEDLMIW